MLAATDQLKLLCRQSNITFSLLAQCNNSNKKVSLAHICHAARSVAVMLHIWYAIIAFRFDSHLVGDFLFFLFSQIYG